MRLILRRALALDFAVAIEAPSVEQLIGRALAALEPARTTPTTTYRVATGPEGHSLAIGDETIRTAASPTELLDALIGHLNLAAITASRGRLLLHAAAVALPDGRAVLLPGPSGSGKTTLAAELVAAGTAYLTDETLAVDPVDLAITTYRKPLTVKPGSFGVLSRLAPEGGDADSERLWQVAVDRLGGADLPAARLRVDLVVAPTYNEGGGTALVRISPAEAVFRLASNSSSLIAVRSRPLEALARLLEGVPAYALRYDDVVRGRDLVLAALEATP